MLKPETKVKYCLEAIQVLKKNGWCQNVFKDEKGRVCAVGALEKVNRDHRRMPNSEIRLFSYEIARKATGCATLTSYNDDIANRKEDVIKVFKDAADLYKKECK